MRFAVFQSYLHPVYRPQRMRLSGKCVKFDGPEAMSKKGKAFCPGTDCGEIDTLGTSHRETERNSCINPLFLTSTTPY